MIIAVDKPMSPRQLEMFWNEMEIIKRNSDSFFPEEQMKNISIDVSEEASTLRFSDEYNLSDVVTLDIRFIFSMVALDDDIWEEYQLLRRLKKEAGLYR